MPQARPRDRKSTMVNKKQRHKSRKQTSFNLPKAGILFLIFGIIGSSLILLSHAATCTVSNTLVPSCGAWFGNYVSYNPTDVLSSESTIGRKYDVVHFYEGWDSTFPSSAQESLAQGGRYLLLDIANRYFSQSGGVCWSAVANGSQNTQIAAMAARIKAMSEPVFISFDHEPEYQVGSTCIPSKGIWGTASDFDAAFRTFHDQFAADGVSNVTWVWDMTGSSTYNALYTSLWPGNSYVNWVAWDPYNWYTCKNEAWKDFGGTASIFYNWLNSNTTSTDNFSSKPYMLAEYGTPEEPGATTAKESWFSNMAGQIQSQPNLKAVVYFDRPDNSGTTCNWQTNTSSSSLAGFIAAGKNSYFNQAHETVTTPAPDTIPPSVSITGPTNNTTVSGPLKVTGNASDNIGVSKVELYVDSKLITTSTSAPYTFTIDTTAYSNTAHSIFLEALDAAGNHANSATTTFNIMNSAPGTPGSSPTPSTGSNSSPGSNASSDTTSSSLPTTTISASAPPSSAPIPVSGDLTVTPATPGTSVSLKVDGKSVSGDSINTTKLTNGTHVVTISEDGKTKTQTISVHNPPVTAIHNYIHIHRTATYVSGGSLLATLLAVAWFGRNTFLRRLLPVRIRH